MSRLRAEGGAATVTAKLIMAIIGAGGIVALYSVDRYQRETAEQRVRESAFQLAQAAMDAQVVPLGATWPETAALAVPATCVSTSPAPRCPDAASLAAAFPGTEANGGSWTVEVRDDIGVGAARYDRAGPADRGVCRRCALHLGQQRQRARVDPGAGVGARPRAVRRRHDPPPADARPVSARVRDRGAVPDHQQRREGAGGRARLLGEARRGRSELRLQPARAHPRPPFTSSRVINTPQDPGRIVVHRGSIAFAGSLDIYALVLATNGLTPPADAGDLVTVTGDATIQGAIFIEGRGGLALGSSNLNLNFDERALDDLFVWGLPAFDHYSFRELTPSE